MLRSAGSSTTSSGRRALHRPRRRPSPKPPSGSRDHRRRRRSIPRGSRSRRRPDASGSCTTRLTSRRPRLRKVKVTCSGQGFGRASSPSVTTPESLPSTSTAAPAGTDRTGSRRSATAGGARLPGARSQTPATTARPGGQRRPGPGWLGAGRRSRRRAGRLDAASLQDRRRHRAPAAPWSRDAGSPVCVGRDLEGRLELGKSSAGGSARPWRRSPRARRRAAPGAPRPRSGARAGMLPAAACRLSSTLPSLQQAPRLVERLPRRRRAGAGSRPARAGAHDARELLRERGRGRGPRPPGSLARARLTIACSCGARPPSASDVEGRGLLVHDLVEDLGGALARERPLPGQELVEDHARPRTRRCGRRAACPGPARGSCSGRCPPSCPLLVRFVPAELGDAEVHDLRRCRRRAGGCCWA